MSALVLFIQAMCDRLGWFVRATVAPHPDAGPYLEALSRDAHWYVRESVARHQDAGPYLERLSRDKHRPVALSAIQRLTEKGVT